MERRQEILAAALAVFDAKGPIAATVEDIRTGSGASVGSIYHHFGGKEGLAEALLVEALGDYQRGFLAALEGRDAQAGVHGGVDHLLRWAERSPARMRYLLGGPPAGEAARGLNRSFFAAVRAWWARHPQLIDADLATAHALWLGPATEYCRHWLAGRAPRPGPERRALFSETAWRSLCP